MSTIHDTPLAPEQLKDASQRLQEALQRRPSRPETRQVFARQFTIELDPDLLLVAEGQAQAFGMTLDAWVKQQAVLGIRMQCGM